MVVRKKVEFSDGQQVHLRPGERQTSNFLSHGTPVPGIKTISTFATWGTKAYLWTDYADISLIQFWKIYELKQVLIDFVNIVELKQDLTLATFLIRPSPLYDDFCCSSKETYWTKGNYGSIPRIYVVCDQDNLMTEDMQRWLIDKNPPDDVKVIKGSDHMVMMSKPHDLCSCLLEIGNKYCWCFPFISEQQNGVVCELLWHFIMKDGNLIFKVVLMWVIFNFL